MDRHWKLARRLWILCGGALFIPMVLIGQSRAPTGSLFLYNDTAFILTATVQASDGTFMGESSIQPGQQSYYSANFQPTPYQRADWPAYSLTPYTVIWQCPSEGYYSLCNDVSPGAMVRASSCPGNHYCDPKQKKNSGSQGQ